MIADRDAYDLVQEGYWTEKQFYEWVDRVREVAYTQGYESGGSDGYYQAKIDLGVRMS